MKTHLIEIRDSGTCISAVAMQPTASDAETEQMVGCDAVKFHEHHLGRSGFLHPDYPERQTSQIILMRLDVDDCEVHVNPENWPGQTLACDPYKMRGTPEHLSMRFVKSPRTMFVAHWWLIAGGFALLPSMKNVVDVEWILGIRDEPKLPEVMTHG